MDYLKETAQALGIDRSTVCRAISRSQLVSIKTQRRVFEYVKEHYPEKLIDREFPKTLRRSDKTITVVMPYKPHYFWDLAAKGVQDAIDECPDGSIGIRRQYYSGVISEEELLLILKGLDTKNTDALALVPLNAARFRDVLEEIKAEIPVAIFNEDLPGLDGVINAVGNSYQEGAALAGMLLESIPEDSCVILLETVCYQSHTLAMRKQGFLDTLREANSNGKHCYVDVCRVVGETDEEEETRKYTYNSILPSLVARRISEKIEKNKAQGRTVRAVYTCNGDMYPLFLALRKLRRLDLLVYGHEDEPKSLEFFRNGCKGGYVRQDIYTQSYVAVKALTALLMGKEPEYPKNYQTPFESRKFD